MSRTVFLVCMLLVGCHKEPTGTSGGADAPARFPYPGPFWMKDGHVDLGDTLPQGNTAVPGDRVAWRTGFSPVQSAVIPVEADLDVATLSGQDGLGVDGTVQLWDLTDGVQLPCFAEVDAYPTADGPRPLLVRPGKPMPVGHTIAVAVTGGVHTLDGAPLASPDWYADAVAGNPGEGVEDYADALKETSDALDGLGVADVVLSFAFPIGDGTAQLKSLISTVTTPNEWDLSTVESRDDEGSTLPVGVWKRIVGTIRTDNWLVEDKQFDLTGETDGLPVPQGQTDALLYVHFPDSVRDAEPGTVPVWLFGHGIFGEPSAYLADPEDADAVIELADRAGAIVIATLWRGFARPDAIVAAQVGADFGTIPQLTDKLAQGVANTYALSKAILDGGLLDDPAFGGLPKKGSLRYYGISLGGIEGAVLLANQPEITHGVFHVGGSTWSTMLERSSNWSGFEGLIFSSGLARMEDRQLLYSVSQLFWDPVDPGNYATELQGRAVLWQESIGDDQVPNLTTEILARGAGAKLLSPSVTTPFGLEAVVGPTQGPVMAQFDSEIGVPPPTNRPSEDTATHETPRKWEGAKAQTLLFLDDAEPGTVEAFCGAAPCTARNTGD